MEGEVIEVRAFREYYNKGKLCLWYQTHDGKDYKLIVTKPPEPADNAEPRHPINLDTRQTPKSPDDALKALGKTSVIHDSTTGKVVVKQTGDNKKRMGGES